MLRRKQKFVGQIAMIPNLKIDYVVLNAGVLHYPNVSLSSSTAMHIIVSDQGKKSRTNTLPSEPPSCTYPPFAEP